MNWWVIFVTFIAVNLDFFVMLLCLVNRYRIRDVMVGYSLALLLLLCASFSVGKVLTIFLPEWLLGLLGFLPIYMALHDNDEDVQANSRKGPVVTTFITYLAVCTGCNLSIFLPVVTGLHTNQFILAACFVIILALIAVALIKWFGSLPTIKHWMTRYSEPLMKVIYVGVGLYVFWDSGLVSHIIKLLV